MKKLELFLLWLREFFKHPIENIRQARPISPNRLYSNFGNVCKAVPYSAEEIAYLKRARNHALPQHVLKDIKGNLKEISDITAASNDKNALPPKCNLCDFYMYGLPCPLINSLTDGTIVCDKYKYIIIKHMQ